MYSYICVYIYIAPYYTCLCMQPHIFNIQICVLLINYCTYTYRELLTPQIEPPVEVTRHPVLSSVALFYLHSSTYGFT